MNKKVNFFSKMSTKIGYLVLAMVIIPMVIITVFTINTNTSTMEDTYKSYAQNLAEEAAVGVNSAVAIGEETYGKYAQDLAENVAGGYDLLVQTGLSENQQMLDSVLGATSLDDVESSYTYMVSKTGTMLYHPDSSKVGKPVENAAVKQIVADLEAGKEVEPGYIIYEYKGATKLAGYDLTSSQNIVVVTADYDEFMKIDYDSLIGNISITGVDGSYAYMVSSDGTMLWHPDTEKIGQPVENAAVKQVVADLEDGKEVTSDAVIYEYKGADKLAGYCIANNGNIIVVTADYDTFIKPVIHQRNITIIMGIVLTLLFVAIGIVLVGTMTKAITLIVPEIQEAASLNFTSNSSNHKLIKRKDEMGVIARELETMRSNLSSIVNNISSASNSINGNVSELLTISQEVNDKCVDNSATSEELAAGMQETSSATARIDENLDEMMQNAREIMSLTSSGATLSGEVKKRAENLKTTTDDATKHTFAMYSNVKDKTAIVIKASEAVEKINELTQTVMSISEQTGVLALNAAIEAARAGESGKGFAVVASEISNLSKQTSTAVNNINDIVREVNNSVTSMIDCLKEIISFLEKHVLEDYKNFGNISEQYEEDANDFLTSITGIDSGITNLSEKLEAIAEALSGINATVTESAGGVTDIAEKSSDMVQGTITTADKVNECRKCVNTLNEIINKFTIEGLEVGAEIATEQDDE